MWDRMELDGLKLMVYILKTVVKVLSEKFNVSLCFSSLPAICRVDSP